MKTGVRKGWWRDPYIIELPLDQLIERYVAIYPDKERQEWIEKRIRDSFDASQTETPE
jgi:hypothetical protein